jgi:hypothetical protein
MANWRWAIFCDWLGEYIWLSLIGPELETARPPKKRKLPVNDWVQTIRAIAAEVVGRSPIVTHALAIVR